MVSRFSLKSSLICSGIVGILMIALLIAWPYLFFKILKNQLILTNTSQSYQMWTETPIPMYLELFLYNFSNADEVLKDKSNTIKPYFVEMGPYVFKEHHSKVNQTWHNKNSSITFWQKRVWHFVPEMSNGSLTDPITNINVVGATINHFSRELPYWVKVLISTALFIEEKNAVITQTAEELLFKGYEDNLIDIANNLNLSQFINIPYDKFGWFYARNESVTYDGVMNMFTGENNIEQLGLLHTWNNEEKVPFFSGECGQVKGGTGELFPPKYNPDDITVFATDICSSVTLKQNGSTEIEGISGSFFVGDDTVFDNGWHYEDQSCYCSNNSHCAHYGARDVSECKFGAPAYVSFPHFYLADPYYMSKIDGIQQNKEQDEFQMGLEVYSGIPLFVRAQLQINIHIKKVSGITFFNKLPDEIYWPMLWFRQEVKLTEEYASQAKLILLVPKIVSYVLYALVAVCLVVFIWALVTLIHCSPKSDLTENLVTESESETNNQ